METQYLNSEDAAAYVRNKYGRPCSANLLTKLSCRGGGPIFRKISRFRVYETQWLDDWVKAQIGPPVRSTSEAGSQRSPRGEHRGEAA